MIHSVVLKAVVDSRCVCSNKTPPLFLLLCCSTVRSDLPSVRRPLTGLDWLDQKCDREARPVAFYQLSFVTVSIARSTAVLVYSVHNIAHNQRYHFTTSYLLSDTALNCTVQSTVTKLRKGKLGKNPSVAFTFL